MSDINYDDKSRAAHLRKICRVAINDALTRLGVQRPAAIAKEIIDASGVICDQVATINKHLRIPRDTNNKTSDKPQDDIDYKNAAQEAKEALTHIMVCYGADTMGLDIPDEFRTAAEANVSRIINPV